MVKKVFREKNEEWLFVYRVLYFIEFCILFLAWFLKRYPFPQPFFLFMSSVSIIGGFAIYLWNLRRTGFSIEKILAGIFALAFLILLPTSDYLDTAVDDLNMILFFLMSVSVDRDDDKLIKALFYFKMVVGILVLFAYNGHVIQDVSGIRPHTDIVRHSYGFMHPNSLGMIFIGLVFDFSLIKKSYNFTGGLVMLLAALLVFAVTDSRTSFFIALAIILCYFLKPILSKVKVSGYAIMPFVVGMFALGLALPRYFTPDNPIFVTLNHLFTGRTGIGHAYLEQFGLNWMPRNIPTFTEINGIPMYDDSFYVDSLLRQGIILFCLYPIFLLVQLKGKKFTLFHSLLFLLTFFINTMEHYGATVQICSILLLNYFALSEEKLEDKY
ncbi:polymerase [Streptococcus equinus]|uniref:polymerase n=1 Tax=Streptococcus equinus TaxID=1335 RepID=UPI003EED5426